MKDVSPTYNIHFQGCLVVFKKQDFVKLGTFLGTVANGDTGQGLAQHGAFVKVKFKVHWFSRTKSYLVFVHDLLRNQS